MNVLEDPRRPCGAEPAAGRASRCCQSIVNRQRQPTTNNKNLFTKQTTDSCYHVSIYNFTSAQSSGATLYRRIGGAVTIVVLKIRNFFCISSVL
jgi:hypothetical protein